MSRNGKEVTPFFSYPCIKTKKNNKNWSVYSRRPENNGRTIARWTGWFEVGWYGEAKHWVDWKAEGWWKATGTYKNDQHSLYNADDPTGVFKFMEGSDFCC